MLWIELFDTLEQLRVRVGEFVADYNERWLLERYGYRTPRHAHQALCQATTA